MAGYTPPAADTTTTDSTRLLADDDTTAAITGAKLCGYTELTAQTGDADERLWIGGASADDTSKTGEDFMKVTTTTGFAAVVDVNYVHSSTTYTAKANVGVGAFAGTTLATSGATAAFADAASTSTFHDATLAAAGKFPVGTAKGYFGYWTDKAVAIDKIAASAKSYALA